MNTYSTRYEALKNYPNAIIRKLLKNGSGCQYGTYAVFNDYSTYSNYKKGGYVK
jgi:hypothetical protein